MKKILQDGGFFVPLQTYFLIMNFEFNGAILERYEKDFLHSYRFVG